MNNNLFYFFQSLLEKLGKTSRTVDTELEAQIETLRDTQRKYGNILRLARALTSHFYHVIQTQVLRRGSKCQMPGFTFVVLFLTLSNSCRLATSIKLSKEKLQVFRVCRQFNKSTKADHYPRAAGQFFGKD